MLRDRHEVNKLKAMMEIDPSIKTVEDALRIIAAQKRCGQTEEMKFARLSAKQTMIDLQRKCVEARKKFPHLAPELYDSPAEIEFAVEMHQRNMVWTPRYMVAGHRLDRSEERRVGKECRSRW